MMGESPCAFENCGRVKIKKKTHTNCRISFRRISGLFPSAQKRGSEAESTSQWRTASRPHPSSQRSTMPRCSLLFCFDISDSTHVPRHPYLELARLLLRRDP